MFPVQHLYLKKGLAKSNETKFVKIVISAVCKCKCTYTYIQLLNINNENNTARMRCGWADETRILRQFVMPSVGRHGRYNIRYIPIYTPAIFCLTRKIMC